MVLVTRIIRYARPMGHALAPQAVEKRQVRHI